SHFVRIDLRFPIFNPQSSISPHRRTLAPARRSSSGMSTTFGRYELRREVGRGAESVVYEATDPSLQRDVALKILSLPEEADPAARRSAIEQFHQEGRALAGLSHPNLAAVLDVGEAGGGCYLALELLRGATLRERMASQERLPAGEVTRI